MKLNMHKLTADALISPITIDYLIEIFSCMCVVFSISPHYTDY